jgi:hypothetical protein
MDIQKDQFGIPRSVREKENDRTPNTGSFGTRRTTDTHPTSENRSKRERERTMGKQHSKSSGEGAGGGVGRGRRAGSRTDDREAGSGEQQSYTSNGRSGGSGGKGGKVGKGSKWGKGGKGGKWSKGGKTSKGGKGGRGGSDGKGGRGNDASAGSESKRFVRLPFCQTVVIGVIEFEREREILESD